MLLQILDDGRLTDSHGRTVNFKNCIIIMTSNIGARLITDKKSLGFTNKVNEEKETAKEYEETKKEVTSELKRSFRPEFINRIDVIKQIKCYCSVLLRLKLPAGIMLNRESIIIID